MVSEHPRSCYAEARFDSFHVSPKDKLPHVWSCENCSVMPCADVHASLCRMSLRPLRQAKGCQCSRQHRTAGSSRFG